MAYVNQKVRKIDADALVSGKPVYTDDLAPRECLIVKLLRSPHAYAKIKDIDTSIAEKVPGVECILTYKNAPRHRFTNAGQTYPEMSPYDRVLVDDTVRYVGDTVAIVAADTEKNAVKATKLIKVAYEVLEPLLDYETALDNKIVVHKEDDCFAKVNFGYEPTRNLLSQGSESYGDVEAEFEKCDVTVEGTYYVKAQEQAMMETFRSYAYLDYSGRMTVVSSTQVPFHARRHIAACLGIPVTKVRVVKPRIGGGFGAKQTSVSEFYPAAVTWLTGKPSKIVYDRTEAFTCSNSRHAMRVKVKVGADREGNVVAMTVDTLSNTGAYGEHGATTVGLSGHKTLPLYNKLRGGRFTYQVVYTNVMPAAAFRGYGATQGCFAVESAVNELAEKLGMDPAELRLKNIAKVGEPVHMYDGAKVFNSSGLRECILKGRELIGWRENYPRRVMENGKIRGMGMAMCMQGSGIAGCDTASVEIRLEDSGFYTLMIGCTDMGTGCDTILAQMAADLLSCPMEKILVHGVDTDISPFDPGSYASSTTYVTGGAVVKAGEKMVELIREEGARLLNTDKSAVDFDGERIYKLDGSAEITLNELAQTLVIGPSGNQLVATATHGSPISPPPFMAGFAETETDPETGKTEIIRTVGVVDCGTPINLSLARIQAEGGLLQGIGLALYEDVRYQKDGRMITNSFMQYKIPSRLDTGEIIVEFAPSFEPTGPFGAKSIGEVVINTPAPAIAAAVYNATGVRVKDLPITPEKVLMGMRKNNGC